jgi:competence protein ComEC
VLVIGDDSWQGVDLGSEVQAAGRLRPADSHELAAVLSASRPPVVLEEPGALLDTASVVRGAIRESVTEVPARERSLVPALVVGDDQGMPSDMVESFRVAGLTHLLAVSGTNLTLVVGFVLILARWLGVRARGLVVVGALGVAGFVLLARAEPSVVRAAAMGSVALIGMGFNGREKGVRALGVAVFLLLLFQPWLALSVGFVLSALATAGILFLAPPWRDALMRWLPRWAAEAVAVPMAAQLVCTPVVAAISGQVSMVAVLANMLVAPAVGPATVLGLAGGVLMLASEAVGLVVGRMAGGCAWWIVAVAEHTAELPTAAVEWSTTAWSLGALALLCVVVAVAMPYLLAGRVRFLSVALVAMLVIARPVPTVGWPPDGWVMVACDVGQGDGLVLNAGDGRAVVVDTGPDPRLIDRCLDRLGITAVPVVVLTHFHADHVDGLPGVLEDRRVGELEVSGVADPEAGAAAVARWAAGSGVALRTPAYGEVARLGRLTWQVIGPSRLVDGTATGEEGSLANNASITMLVNINGVRILLTGDIEPEAQQRLEQLLPDLHVDVVKVPHHGSRYQDPEFLSGLGARLAVISAGEDNDYGHPSAQTLDLLGDSGMTIRRTDRHGDVAVVVGDDGVGVVTSRR